MQPHAGDFRCREQGLKDLELPQADACDLILLSSRCREILAGYGNPAPCTLTIGNDYYYNNTMEINLARATTKSLPEVAGKSFK